MIEVLIHYYADVEVEQVTNVKWSAVYRDTGVQGYCTVCSSNVYNVQ